MLNNSQSQQFIAPPQSSSLGIIAQNPSHAQKVDFGTVARRRYKLLRAAAGLLPDERISQCQSRVAPEIRAVAVEVDDTDSNPRFRNLICCDSPQCPFCSVARSEQDRHELSVALAEAKRLGYFPVLMTFTLSHHAGDSLDALRSGLRDTFDKTFSGRWYQDLQTRYEFAGKITASETTIGRNGWHPHLHILFFGTFDFDLKSLDALRSEVGQRWQDKLKKIGLTANLAHGVDVRSADSDIAEYISKWGHEPIDSSWGADTEIAKANVKRSVHGGLTPFQLLGVVAGIQADIDAAVVVFGPSDLTALKSRCGALFCEFWHAYKGRARIHWGKMRKLLDLDVALENYALLNHEEKPEKWDIVTIERGENWNRIRGFGGDDLRAELLAVCASRDVWKVRNWLRKHGVVGEISDHAYDRSIILGNVSSEDPQ